MGPERRIRNPVLRFFLEPPQGLAPGGHRIHALLSVGTASAVVLHAFYLGLFHAWGVREMALANLVSIPAYLLAFVWNRRGCHGLAAGVAALELCAHQALSVHFVGWEAGLQYYLLVLPPVVFSLPGRRLALKVGWSVLAAATFLVLMGFGRDRVPVHAVAPWALGVALLVNVAIVFALLGFFAFHYARAAEVAESRLQVEFDRAEGLLHSILPVSIADRLKQSEGVIADGFAEASVLFADLEGFTGLAERLAPERLVAVLNEIFRDFDDLVERHGLEKIKTIGDAYMVAAGLPISRPDHAEALADLARDMMLALEERSRALGLPLRMRVGINSGRVVAGVIGRRRFIYDLWGDCVNVASRMEAHGVPGRIQVTRATRDRLVSRYRLESRGEIVVKGKGLMEVFLLGEPISGPAETCAPPAGP